MQILMGIVFSSLNYLYSIQEGLALLYVILHALPLFLVHNDAAVVDIRLLGRCRNRDLVLITKAGRRDANLNGNGSRCSVRRIRRSTADFPADEDRDLDEPIRRVRKHGSAQRGPIVLLFAHGFCRGIPTMSTTCRGSTSP